MATRITCPGCGVELSVLDGAPARVTCPRCLARLKTESAKPEIPKRAIPLEQEAGRDTLWAFRSLLILSLLMILGTVLAMINHKADLATICFFGTGLLGAFTFILWAKADAESRGLYFNEKPRPVAENISSGKVLDYEAPPSKRPSMHGCLLVLLICVGVACLIVGLCFAVLIINPP